MNLEYKILWIDDNIEFIRAPLNNLKTAIENFGFIPKIEHFSDKKEIISLIDSKKNDYDLILMDYMLDTENDFYGNHLLKSIREHKIYTNVIFYSSFAGDLFEIVFKDKLQGVFVFDRIDFRSENIDQVIQIIEYTLKKELDLNTMRGMIMAEVALFDRKIMDIIELTIDADLKKLLINSVLYNKEKNYKDVNKMDTTVLYNNICCREKGTRYLESNARSDFLHSKVLKEKLNANNLESLFNGYYEELKSNYTNEVIRKRNKLAHQIDINLTDDEMKQIRKDIIKHRNNLNELSSKITELANSTS